MSSHREESCWGKCRICHWRGHNAGKEGTTQTTSTSTEAAKASIEKKMKKKKAGDKATGTETPVEEVDTESDSKLDSPVRPVVPAPATENARGKRANVGTANKAFKEIS